MIYKIAFILFGFVLMCGWKVAWTEPTAANEQAEWTIPKKHRVIQEKLPQVRSVPVGSKLSDFDFKTLQGNMYTLSSLVKQGAVVFVFLSAECPVAQRYAMRLKRMHAKWDTSLTSIVKEDKGDSADRHVTFIGVYANENDSVNEVKTYLAKAEYVFPIVKDSDGSLARHLGATMTPQAHLIDISGVLRYRGPIDDNRYVTRVKHHYLKDAIVAVLDGKPVPVKETAAFGCTIHLPDPPIPLVKDNGTWALGKPDIEKEIPIAFKKLSKGKHASLTMTIKTDFGEDVYVQAIDFKPEKTKTVLRIITNFKTQPIGTPDGNGDPSLSPLSSKTKGERTADVRLGIWTPGSTPTVLPEGVGYLLPKGGQIILNVLYEGTDRAEQDNLKVGLYLSKTSETSRLYKATLSKNVNRQHEVLSYQFKTDAYVFAAYPSMDTDKQDVRVIAITPTGERIKMLRIKESPTEWLNERLDSHYYREPIFLPAGSRLEFDVTENSEDQKREEPLDLTCHFLYVLASEYVPD